MATTVSLFRIGSRLANIQLCRNNLTYCSLRTFLSDAYQCSEAWKKRLQAPVLKEVNCDELYYDLLKKFQSSGKASPIDVDLFVNSVSTESHVDELITITNRFRRSPSTVHALPSTPHAVIRTLLDHNETDTLMKLLDDRLNYGLFPDYYLSNLMMDRFLKQSNYRDAVKVAIQMMLQEDFDHPIASQLALYSCYAYLRNPVPEPWDPRPQPKPAEPEEVVKVRVDYLREPYFDDHFDLTEPNKLVGKTLFGLAKYFNKKTLDASVVQTSYLTGLVLYEKYDKLSPVVQGILDAKVPVYREWLDRCKQHLGGADSSQLPEGLRENFTSFVQQLEKNDLVLDTDILGTIKTSLEVVVKERENHDIETQLKVYEHWIQRREEELQKQVDEYLRQQRIANLEAKKEELKKKEETLFFFENQTQWELLHEEKEKLRQERDKQAQKSKGQTKAQKQAEEEAYIPPEVQKRAAK